MSTEWGQPHDEFAARVREEIKAESWIVDGNYSTAIREMIWKAADMVVWLDLPRFLVMKQLAGRVVRNLLSGAELWNGNRERPLRDQLSLDPKRSILAWSWQDHRRTREQYSQAMTDPTFAHVHFVRLRSRHAVQRFVRALGR